MPAEVRAQELSRVWVVVAGGVASSTAGDSLFRASTQLTGRLALGVRLGTNWGVEVSGLWFGKTSGVDYYCLPTSPASSCPAFYSLQGLSAVVQREFGRAGGPGVWRAEIGGGVYRVIPRLIYADQSARTTSSTGPQLALSRDVLRLDRLILSLGLRELVLPNVASSTLWVTHIELAVRVRM